MIAVTPGGGRDLPLTPGSSGTDTEEGRAFFQSRLSTLGLAVFALSGTFYVVQVIAWIVLMGTPHHPEVAGMGPLSPAALLQLGATLVAGALWVATRRGSVPAAWLPRLDAGALFGMCGLFQASSVFIPDSETASFIAILTTFSVLVTRSIVVPSRARRTLVITIECTASMILLVLLACIRWDAPPIQMVSCAINAPLWGALIVTICTLASHTIFGLRRAVGEARVLGQYTLEEKIGEGGMGEVWRASHAMLRRPTAVKLLPTARAGEAAIRRFAREVTRTARLTHPSTVAIFDYGRTPDGVFYYAMELLDGLDLERLVAADGPQPPERVVHVLRQVCGALAEAHDVGLVHRDVKPGNILVVPRPAEDEVAKIVDFGLVKDLDGSTATAANLTTDDTITGTPLYMAPEAIRSPELIDGRADLYALGAVGWFLLTGRPLFDALSILEVCSHHLHTIPDRPSVRSGRDLPADLEDALLWCLKKDPAARPANARELRDALDRCTSAGAWTPARAAAWWATHRERPRAELGTAPTSPRTLAVDLARRQAT